MPHSTSHVAENQTLRCPACKEEFLAYKGMKAPRCPRCGHKVRLPVQRRTLRLIAVSIVLGFILVVVVVYFLKR
jgi:DNA-directed RNA polymerase subunit RPC12/RpoP